MTKAIFISKLAQLFLEDIADWSGVISAGGIHLRRHTANIPLSIDGIRSIAGIRDTIGRTTNDRRGGDKGGQRLVFRVTGWGINE